VNFADQATGRVWLSVVAGKPVWADAEALRQALADPDIRAGLSVALPALASGEVPAGAAPPAIGDDERRHTVGDWGAGRARGAAAAT
jgi:hypothetical protein